jgi:hypothetical protein
LEGEKLTFAIIAEAHLCLAEANGIFPRTDAIEGFELGLCDVLWGASSVSPEHASDVGGGRRGVGEKR